MLTFLTNFQTLCAKCANLLMQQLNTDCCSTRTTSHFFGGRWRTTLEMMQFFDKKKAGRIFYSLFYCIMHKVYIKKEGKRKAIYQILFFAILQFCRTMNWINFCIHNWFEKPFKNCKKPKTQCLKIPKNVSFKYFLKN